MHARPAEESRRPFANGVGAVGFDVTGWQSAFCLDAELFGTSFGDRFVVILREQDGDTGRFQSLLEQTRDGEVERRLLYWSVLTADEKALLHPCPRTANMAGIKRDAPQGRWRCDVGRI